MGQLFHNCNIVDKLLKLKSFHEKESWLRKRDRITDVPLRDIVRRLLSDRSRLSGQELPQESLEQR